MISKDFLKEGFIEDASSVHQDHEVQMARKECYHTAENAIALHKLLAHMTEGQGLEGWISAKITLANDYLNTVREHLEYQLMQPNHAHAGMMVSGPGLPVAEGAIKEGKVKELAQDLKDLNDKQFKTKYGKTKAEMQKGLSEKPKVNETSAGSVAGVVNPGGKPKSQVGSLFGGTYQQHTEDKENKKSKKNVKEGSITEERQARLQRIRVLAESLGIAPPGEQAPIDKLAQWIKLKFDKAAYVAKKEGKEVGKAVKTIYNWKTATPKEKAKAKEDLTDIGQFVASSVAIGLTGKALLGATVAHAGVGAVAQHAPGVEHAAELANEVVSHIVADLGLEGIADVLSVAGLKQIKRAIHDVTSTSSGQEWERVHKIKQRIKNQPMAGPQGHLPEQSIKGVAEAAKWRTHPDAHDYDTDGSYMPKGGIKSDPLSIRQGASKTQSGKDPRSMAGKYGAKYAKKHGVPTKQLMKNIPLNQDVAEGVPTAGAQYDDQTTFKMAQQLVAAIEKTTSAKSEINRGQTPGTYQIVVNPMVNNRAVGSGTGQAGPGASVQNINAAIDPYYRDFRAKGWMFTQPMQNQFTIGIPKQQGVAEGSTESLMKKFRSNENNNNHSGNIILLAKHFGTKEELAMAKEALRYQYENEGFDFSDPKSKKYMDFQQMILRKYFRRLTAKQGVAEGSKHAKMGGVGAKNKPAGTDAKAKQQATLDKTLADKKAALDAERKKEAAERASKIGKKK